MKGTGMSALPFFDRMLSKRDAASDIRKEHPAICPENTRYEQFERILYPRVLSSEEVYTKDYLKAAKKAMAKTLKMLPSCSKERTASSEKCLKGIILGDMYGSPFEFTGGVMPECNIKNIALQSPGKWTDDTAMTISSLRAVKEIKEKRISGAQATERFKAHYRQMAHEYPNLGYGGHFYQWAVFDTDDPGYISYGNGSAMRAGIIGAISGSIKECIQLSYLSALPTHAHPEGIKGAVCTAVMTYFACHNADKKTLLDTAKVFYPHGARTEEEDSSPLFGYLAPDLGIEEIRALYPKTLSVTCMESVPLAISLVLLSETYEDFIKYLSVVPMDADTVGAIGGGMMAAIDAADLSGFQIKAQKDQNKSLPPEMRKLFAL